MTLNCLFRTSLLVVALAALPDGAAMGQAMGSGGNLPYNDTETRTKLDAPRPEGGWKGLANLLEALKPGVDTRQDPTPSQITTYIERLLNEGNNQEALAMIEQREAAIQGQRGTDVQLMFQHARTLAALDRMGDAVALYTDMTTRFPELPEPWNNLAALYAQEGELERAYEALNMALRADPQYPEARANMGDVQLLLELRAYRNAAKQAVPGTIVKAREIKNMLKESQHR